MNIKMITMKHLITLAQAIVLENFYYKPHFIYILKVTFINKYTVNL